MGDSILLFTPATVTDADVGEIVTALGGIHDGDDLILSGGGGTIWPGVDPYPPEQEFEPEHLAAMAQAVGEPVRTLVAVDLSRSPGTLPVAGRFVEAFASRYPCIVSRFHCCEKLITPERAVALLTADTSLSSEPCPVHDHNRNRAGWRRWLGLLP